MTLTEKQVALIHELRRLTGIGLMESKWILNNNKWELDRAIQYITRGGRGRYVIH